MKDAEGQPAALMEHCASRDIDKAERELDKRSGIAYESVMHIQCNTNTIPTVSGQNV